MQILWVSLAGQEEFFVFGDNWNKSRVNILDIWDSDDNVGSEAKWWQYEH